MQFLKGNRFSQKPTHFTGVFETHLNYKKFRYYISSLILYSAHTKRYWYIKGKLYKIQLLTTAGICYTFFVIDNKKLIKKNFDVFFNNIKDENIKIEMWWYIDLWQSLEWDFNINERIN